MTDKEKLRDWLARHDRGDLCNTPNDFIVSCLRAHLSTLDAVSKEDAERALRSLEFMTIPAPSDTLRR